MEEDRFQYSGKLYIVCMICMLLSLVLFAGAFYILPNFFWGWVYNMPTFVILWIEYLRQDYFYTERMAKIIIFLSFLIPAIITGIICFITSNIIENKVQNKLVKGIPPLPQTITDKPNETQFKETFNFSLQVIMMILLVIAVIYFIEWLIIPQETL